MQVIPRNAIAVVASSRSLVESLENLGLHVGDKIRSNSTVPPWIFGKAVFKKACLRGLMDTDGSVYIHRHLVRGQIYRHVEMSFTGHCGPLLNSVHRLFLELGFRSRIDPRYNHVFLHRQDDARRYMAEIGTRNPHHQQEFERHGRGAGAVERPRLEIV